MCGPLEAMTNETIRPLDQDGVSDERGSKNSALRALEILETLASTDGRSLRELTDSLRLPRASLHRMLRTLEGTGFLVENGQRYSIGPRGYRLAKSLATAGQPIHLAQRARPILEMLAAETNETVILGRLSEGRSEIVYVDVIVAESPLQYAVPSGDRRPLYSSATGKSVLAFMPPTEQSDYIGKAEFKAITPFTTRRNDLEPILGRIRQHAVVHDKDGHFIGAGAIASPIFDANGEVFASIVVAGPNDRLDLASKKIKDMVREAAQEITRLMGYEGSYPPSWPSPALG